MSNTALQNIETAFQTAQADVATFIADVKQDGAAVVAWIEKEVPSATSAINQLSSDAQTAASTLATLAAQDASGGISALAGAIETALANYASVSKLPSQAGSAITTVETDAIALAQQVANAAVSVGLTKIVALVAPAL